MPPENDRRLFLSCVEGSEGIDMKITPMMKQYLQIKQQVQDAFLFFRLGDFYELFYEDAKLAAKELEITLTSRGGETSERIPMCGVPYHSVDQYIQRLIEKGYKVAICEQVEDPAVAKGVVRREVVRIVTPGTVMDGKGMDDTSNHYLVGVGQHESDVALAACDLSTGEIFITSAALPQAWLLEEVHVYMPTEIIGCPSLLQQIKPASKAWNRAVLFTEWEQFNEQLAREQFGEATWMKLNIEQQQVLALLMSYLHHTQKRTLGQLTTIQVYESQQYVVLDSFTRRNLELTETVRERSKTGSLLWLLDQTNTAMGARMLRRWMDKPLLNRQLLEQRLEAVDTLYHHLIWREEIREQLAAIYDLERLVSRIAVGTANGRDLVALKTSLHHIPMLKQVCVETGSTTLAILSEQLDACEHIRNWIEQVIVDDPPVSVRDGGLIKPGYDTYLDQLRAASSNGKLWMAQLEQQERKTTGIRSLKIGYNKVFGYYIEVTKVNLSSLPPGRYERKQTLANAERFVTKELKEKEALILDAEDKLLTLEYERFHELRQRISDEMKRLQTLATAVAEIDVYQSLATVSVSRRFVRPSFTESIQMQIEAGRHPVVEAMLSQEDFIANDTILSDTEAMLLLITGPNMAGKSTYMRQVALIAIMAQMGCFVPAQQAVMPMIDRIFTRIGAADDLIGGQSTFMVEMMDIEVMIAHATPRSLVIIDELGRGTSTHEGMSIAQAVIEHIHNQIGCKALVSTHFHELAHVADHLSHVRNMRMAVQESENQVVFLRTLIAGAATTSYGIYCARLAGLPAPIIARSYELLQQYSVSQPAVILENEIEEGDCEYTVQQLSLFAEQQAAVTDRDVSLPEMSRSSVKIKNHAPMEVELQQQVEKNAEWIHSLQQLDVMSMTPLQAMQQLHLIITQARSMKTNQHIDK